MKTIEIFSFNEKFTYSYISTFKISNEWSYLLQEVAILQIFWWLVNLKEHFLQKVCAPAGARTHTHQITDLGVSALLTELQELSYK